MRFTVARAPVTFRACRVDASAGAFDFAHCALAELRGMNFQLLVQVATPKHLDRLIGIAYETGFCQRRATYYCAVVEARSSISTFTS